MDSQVDQHLLKFHLTIMVLPNICIYNINPTPKAQGLSYNTGQKDPKSQRTRAGMSAARLCLLNDNKDAPRKSFHGMVA